MSSSDTPPAAASAALSQDNDETLARKLEALEQLTEVYGFGPEAASQAIDIMGPDVPACCTYILDSGLGHDQGGPVVPKEDCPHMEQHCLLSVSQLDDSFDPFHTTCSHFQDTTTTNNNNTTTTSPETTEASGRAKVDMDHDTGVCSSKENWLCLECGVLRCSRYVNGHGVQHWETTKAHATGENPKVGHCIGLSLSDLSVWCYQCGSYLKHPSLFPLMERCKNSSLEKTRKTMEI